MEDIAQKLLNHSVEYAKELLIDTLEFYPFGAYIDNIENVHPLEFEYDKKNQPTVEIVLNSLNKYCKTEMANDKMKAFALTYESEVQLSKDEDTLKCITVEIHIHDGDTLPKYFIPYHINDENKVSFDEIFAVK
jgi:hypothetical protein